MTMQDMICSATTSYTTVDEVSIRTQTKAATLERKRVDSHIQLLDSFIHEEPDCEPMLVLLCSLNNQLYVAGTWDLTVYLHTEDLSTWKLIPIELDMIHPRYQPHCMTSFNDSDAANIFVKRADYIGELLAFNVRISHLHTLDAQVMEREVVTCEMLMARPHPNVAKYHGCLVGKQIHWKGALIGDFPCEMVKGLCYERYDCSLSDLTDEWAYIDIPKALADIEAGIKHIHSFGLVHCDIKPPNIFYKDGTFVVGDFDSTHPVGHPLMLKMGTPEWCDHPPGTPAEFAHDFEALGEIKEWLIDYMRVREDKLHGASRCRSSRWGSSRGGPSGWQSESSCCGSSCWGSYCGRSPRRVVSRRAKRDGNSISDRSAYAVGALVMVGIIGLAAVISDCSAHAVGALVMAGIIGLVPIWFP